MFETIARMKIDWITWTVFAVGLIMLVYWCIQTIREFLDLFRRRLKRTNQ